SRFEEGRQGGHVVERPQAGPDQIAPPPLRPRRRAPLVSRRQGDDVRPPFDASCGPERQPRREPDLVKRHLISSNSGLGERRAASPRWAGATPQRYSRRAPRFTARASIWAICASERSSAGAPPSTAILTVTPPAPAAGSTTPAVCGRNTSGPRSPTR